MAELPPEMREQWIWTVLAVTATEPQRRAFIAGYNGYQMPSEQPSESMTKLYARGQVVSAILNPPKGDR